MINPAHNGKAYRYAWLVADAVDDAVEWGPPQALLKVSVQRMSSVFFLSFWPWLGPWL